nr:MAG TPA: hypothetical protein [Caudoviricetes sp.]
MTNQLILDGVYLPESKYDKFSCWEEPLVVTVDMISGRRVQEIRGGKVWKATYAFDSMGTDKLRAVLAVLRSGKAFPAVVLPDLSDAMVSSRFVLESITQPTYAFSVKGKGVWHNLAFTIREVTPHD